MLLLCCVTSFHSDSLLRSSSLFVSLRNQPNLDAGVFLTDDCLVVTFGDLLAASNAVSRLSDGLAIEDRLLVRSPQFFFASAAPPSPVAVDAYRCLLSLIVDQRDTGSLSAPRAALCHLGSRPWLTDLVFFDGMALI